VKVNQSAELASIVSKFSPFLKEVRKRISYILITFVVATLFGFIFYEKIIKFLIGLLSLEGINIVFTSPFQFINLAFSCGLACGVIAVLPLLLAQLVSFLRPALNKKEYKVVARLLPFSIVLFLIGFGFGAFIMKWQIDIFLDSTITLGIGNVLDISSLLTTILITSVALGIAFEFPIILLLLMHIGVIKSGQLSSKRLWIYLGSFLFALLLPLDSILADIFLALPLIILFEFTLFLNRFFSK
jgi:sec-independent protein translocase protein TatC